MIDNDYFAQFQEDTVDKQLEIKFDGGTITNTEIHSQQFELNESLCSESELRFGSCESNSIKFKVSNIFTPLKDKWLTVSMTLGGNAAEPFLIGKYKVYSDVPTADRKFRDVVAYDAMYDIINADVAEWYNSVLPKQDSAITMKAFRTSFLQHFGIEQETATLVNDDMAVTKTIEPSELSGKDVITAICEINGCFGHIGRNGKFNWIYLPQMIQGLYPANDLFPDHAPDYLPYQQDTGHLYPQDPKSTRIGKGFYISCSYEDFITKGIKKLQIRQEENDVGAIVGTDGNCYIIEDNFLVYGKSAADLENIANKILDKIKNIVYRPFEADCKGNPCFEVSDPVRFSTKYEIVESYILQRTLKGIQALRDSYSADGAVEYTERVNSVQRSIIQLKGKTNVLTRTVEENRLEVKDIEKNLSSEITQNANEIALRVKKDSIISEINLSPEKITIQAEKIDLKGLVNADELVTKFATITTLNTTTANLESLISTKATIDSLNAVDANLKNLIADKASVGDLNAANARIHDLEVDKLSVDQFTAEKISAMNITVQSGNVTGGFDASKITSGSISADRIDASVIANKISQIAVVEASSINVKNVFTLWSTYDVDVREENGIKYLIAVPI